MIWTEAKAVASKMMKDLSVQFRPAEIRLILRALSRFYHREDKQPKSAIPAQQSGRTAERPN